MSRIQIALALVFAFALSNPLLAQPEEDAADEALDEEEELLDEEDDLEDDDDVIGDEEDEPELRAPTLEMPDLGDVVEGDPDDEDEPEDVVEDEADLLRDAEPDGPPSADPTQTRWTAPQSVLTLHGYFRVRGELQDSFFLGRDDVPFNFFTPSDRGVLPEGGCRSGTAVTDSSMAEDRDFCNNSDRLRFANMRMRLRPTLALSDDVRVHMTLDVFDNLVLGSTADGTVYLPPGTSGTDNSNPDFENPARTPGVPIDSFAATQNPPQANRNSARDSIYVRHAWAEVTNRGLGQLRFGRMPSQWGLGVLANAGEGIDADQSSDVDRVMALTRIAGLYIIAAWDFAGQGLQAPLLDDLRGVPFDTTSKDDINQYVFALAYRQDEEEARDRLQRGGWVFDAGFYFVLRNQFLSSARLTQAYPARADFEDAFVRRNARAFIPDLWLRFRMGGLRLETEAVFIAGSIQNIENDSFVRSNFDIRQFGIAFEGEYRLLNDKLSIRLYTGYASGDPDIDGLSQRQGLLAQQTDDRTISHMQFHPNYRVDLILWRNIMGRVAGAWYLKPGVSYDIIRNPFGQLFGVGFDMIYSRAAQETQTYGADPNLGLELDFTIYYRSEDGPELMDGFYAQFNYGVLFPFAGLKYPNFQGLSGAPAGFSSRNAQTLRLILGVNF
ncbi:MAG: TIGR04551 family protein [Myxococcota bacterium]